jgi:hypothetical protein
MLASTSRGRYLLPLMNAVTALLTALGQGEPHAASRLLPPVYDALRRLAAQRMVQVHAGQTLQSTALVHEDLKGFDASSWPARRGRSVAVQGKVFRSNAVRRLRSERVKDNRPIQ